MSPKPVDEIINRSCVSKKSFRKEAADAVVDTHAKRGELIYYYKCLLCSRYHLTSSAPRNGIKVKVI